MIDDINKHIERTPHLDIVTADMLRSLANIVDTKEESLALRAETIVHMEASAKLREDTIKLMDDQIACLEEQLRVKEDSFQMLLDMTPHIKRRLGEFQNET